MARRLNVRAILNKYGLRPKRSWSQNFLVDVEVLTGIADAAAPASADATVDWPGPGGCVLDLGAGIGALTAMLAKRAQRVVAIERDRELAKLLRHEFAGDPVVEVMEANAASVDLGALGDRLSARPAVAGNLPYHMAAPILFHLVSAREHLAHWVLMFQREMAERLVAAPGSRTYGVVSVLIGRVCDVDPVLDVPPDAFHPAPKVHSRVLRFRPLSAPRVAVRDPRLFEQVVKGAFSQRRKKVRNSLLGAFSERFSAEGVDACLTASGIDGGLRAERLTLDQFARLADAFSERSPQ